MKKVVSYRMFVFGLEFGDYITAQSRIHFYRNYDV